MSHVSSEIRFDELDPITLIVGIKNDNGKQSNGSGKSAIFDAITWALYEKSRASGSSSTGIDDIVRGGTDSCEVEFHFLLSDNVYRVIRSRDKKRRKSDVTFQIKGAKKWQSVSGDSKKETNAHIVQHLGLDFDVFVNSVLLGQHEASAFADMTSSERKDVVAKILQLSHYDTYSMQAKGRLQDLDNKTIESDMFIRTHGDVEKNKIEAEQDLVAHQEKIEVYQKRIKALRSVLDKIRQEQSEEGKKLGVVKDLNKQHESVKQRIQSITLSIKRTFDDVKTYENRLKKRKEIIIESQNRLLEIKNERGDPNQLKVELRDSEEALQKFTEQRTSLIAKLSAIGSQIKTLREEEQRIDSLNEGACPTCYQSVTSTSKQGALKVIHDKVIIYEEKLKKGYLLLEEVKEKLKISEEKVAVVLKNRDKFNKLQEEGRRLVDSVGREKEEFNNDTVTLENRQSERKSHNESLVSAQEEITQCLTKLESLGNVDPARFNELTKQVTEKNSELEFVEASATGLQQKIGGIQERIKSQQEVLARIAIYKEQQVGIDRERRIEKELISAFGKVGIQALILENSAIEIEKIANELLSKLTDGSVRVQIQTQKPNQDGTIREVFDIIITDEHHSSPFAMYSGGEKFRIAFVIRIALSILLSRRSGARVSAIFYDEAFQDLDEDGIDRMMTIFKILSQDFRHQLVITHTSQLKDYFNDILIVRKTAEGSYVDRK